MTRSSNPPATSTALAATKRKSKKSIKVATRQIIRALELDQAAHNKRRRQDPTYDRWHPDAPRRRTPDLDSLLRMHDQRKTVERDGPTTNPPEDSRRVTSNHVNPLSLGRW